MTPLRVAAAAATLALVAAACGSKHVAAPVVPRVFDLQNVSTLDMAKLRATTAAPETQGQLQLALESLFEWHGISLTFAMRATTSNAAGRDGWIDALAMNADDITRALALTFDQGSAESFRQQWAQHAQFLIDYASARRFGDAKGMAEARRNLAAYERDNARFLERATAGALPAATVEKLLHDHVERMITQVDQTAAGDPDAATANALDDHTYLIAIADALAPKFGKHLPLTNAAVDASSVYCSLVGGDVGAYAIGALARLSAKAAGYASSADVRLDGLATTLDGQLRRAGAEWGPLHAAVVAGDRADPTVHPSDPPAAGAPFPDLTDRWTSWQGIARLDPNHLADVVKGTLDSTRAFTAALPTPSPAS